MASIEPTKRGPDGKPARDTRWTVRYRDPAGRSRERTFARKVDAEAFRERNGVDVRTGEWVDPAVRRALFDDWAAAWWATTVKLAPTTRRRYHQLLHNDVLPFFGGRRLAEVDYMDVEEFIAALLGRGLSPKVARDAVSVVSLIFGCAVKGKVRRDNPAAGHHIPRRQKKVRPGDVPDMADLARLVSHTRDPYKPAVWVLALTGMRPSELAGLRVRSVDFARRRIAVDTSVVPVHRFGDEAFRLVEGPTKTQAGDRDVPVPAWLCDLLAAMLAGRAAATGGPVHRDAWLFTQPKGGPLNVKWFREFVTRPALRAAELPDTLRTYDVRHAHASLLIEQGASPLAVAHRLGHSDASVTLKVYSHLFEGVQETLTGKLDELARAAEAALADGPAVVALDDRRPATDGSPSPTETPHSPTENRASGANSGQRRSTKKVG